MQKAIPRNRTGFTRVQALNRAGNKTFQIRTVLAQDKVYMTKHNLVVVPELVSPPVLPSAQVNKAKQTAEFIAPKQPDHTQTPDHSEIADPEFDEPTQTAAAKPVKAKPVKKAQPVRKTPSKA